MLNRVPQAVAHALGLFHGIQTLAEAVITQSLRLLEHHHHHMQWHHGPVSTPDAPESILVAFPFQVLDHVQI
jgi:hypothetical protein